jgi:hypothetical protein
VRHTSPLSNALAAQLAARFDADHQARLAAAVREAEYRAQLQLAAQLGTLQKLLDEQNARAAAAESQALALRQKTLELEQAQAQAIERARLELEARLRAESEARARELVAQAETRTRNQSALEVERSSGSSPRSRHAPRPRGRASWNSHARPPSLRANSRNSTWNWNGASPPRAAPTKGVCASSSARSSP